MPCLAAPQRLRTRTWVGVRGGDSISAKATCSGPGAISCLGISSVIRRRFDRKGAGNIAFASMDRAKILVPGDDPPQIAGSPATRPPGALRRGHRPRDASRRQGRPSRARPRLQHHHQLPRRRELARRRAAGPARPEDDRHLLHRHGHDRPGRRPPARHRRLQPAGAHGAGGGRAHARPAVHRGQARRLPDRRAAGAPLDAAHEPDRAGQGPGHRGDRQHRRRDGPPGGLPRHGGHRLDLQPLPREGGGSRREVRRAGRAPHQVRLREPPRGPHRRHPAPDRGAAAGAA